MIEQVMELAQALGGAGQDEDVLRTLCANACQMLDRRLRNGLTPEDCEGAYPLAAAWLAMDWLRGGQGLEGITSLSAGDISVRRDGASDGEKLSERAMELMAPFLRDDGFVFRGVRG
ncbi:MAG: hypothetical protein K2M42_05110 [Oscillospiraceae bacterium]|nr:hypothetical protein [Oscillospiraceae bacterium]